MSLLTDFAASGVIAEAPVEVARRCGELFGESDQRVILALALAVRALEHGSVCFDPRQIHQQPLERTDDDDTPLPWPDPDEWLTAISSSRLVTVGEQPEQVTTPLRLVDGQLYLEKYWLAEEATRIGLERRFIADPPVVDAAIVKQILDEKFPPEFAPHGRPDEARLAAEHAAHHWVTVIAGGPGTGKTTTIKRIAAVLGDIIGPTARIRLAAPTGRAAARLTEATGLPAQTLHKLLGLTPFRPEPHHHAGNPLPCDVVIVDELSMVSLPLMQQLVDAVAVNKTRLVLVGDPDQLESVEAGAVLADITRSQAPVCHLTHTWRYGGRLADVATALKAGDADAVCELLTAPIEDAEIDNARLVDFDPTKDAVPDDLIAAVTSAQSVMTTAAKAGDAEAALQALSQHRLLCAHRVGPWGLYRWNREVEAWLGHRSDEWYPGRPLLVTRTDKELGLTNGDTGVVIATAQGPRIVFDTADQQLRTFAPTQLDHLQTVHALTVHKAQGSQFRHVSVLLPPIESPLLTRELVYTALTRATKNVTVYGSLAAVREAATRPASRASGLARRLLAS